MNASRAVSIDQRVYDIVSEEYLEQFDLVWLDESAFNNTQALAVKRAFAEEKGISTISELAEIAGDLTIVAPSDFVERPDGLPSAPAGTQFHSSRLTLESSTS